MSGKMSMEAVMTLDTSQYASQLNAIRSTQAASMRGMAGGDALADLRREMGASFDTTRAQLTKLQADSVAVPTQAASKWGAATAKIKAGIGEIGTSMMRLTGPIMAIAAAYQVVGNHIEKLKQKNAQWANISDDSSATNRDIDRQITQIETLADKKELLAKVDDEIARVAARRARAEDAVKNEGVDTFSLNSWKQALGMEVDVSGDVVVNALKVQEDALRNRRRNITRISDESLRDQERAAERRENIAANSDVLGSTLVSMDNANREAAFELKMDASKPVQQLDLIRERLEEIARQAMDLEKVDIGTNKNTYNDIAQQTMALNNERLRLTGQAAQIERELALPKRSVEINADRFARIGLFNGGSGMAAPALAEARRTSLATEKSARLLEVVANRLDRERAATLGE